MTKLPAVTKIISVRDTRDRIEIDDRWVPVPGTGVLRPCDRCGREHEIHVDVELSDGTHSNIGSGCAKGESMEVQSRLKSAVSAAKTRSKLRAELGVVRDQHERAEKAWRDVKMLSAPATKLLESVPERHGGTRQVWGMGDAVMWTIPGGPGFDADRQRSLEDSWRNKRYREQGFDLPPYSYKLRVDDLTHRLMKIERKLAGMMF